MISLIIEKCYKLKHLKCLAQNDTEFEESCQSIGGFKHNNKLNQLFLNQFLFKFRVNAIENEVKDNNINTNIDNKNNNNVDNTVAPIYEDVDIRSKEYMEKMKTMSVWESIRYLINRNVDKNDEKYEKQFIKEGETGSDRVQMMFSEYFNGEDNPEMQFIMTSVGYGFLAGGIYGGVVSNKTAVFDFMRRHNEYVFRGDFEAKRKIRDTMWLQLVKAGARWSWRVALFSGGLTGLTTTAIAYRNKVYITDCMISCAVITSLWKMKLGLRAMAVSGVVGSIFGAFFGASVKLMLWTFNTTVPEYRHWRHLRYTGHLEVEKYSDGTTEYEWKLRQRDGQKQPDYQKALNDDSIDSRQ